MSAIQGPGIFLAQFCQDEAPYNNLPDLCRWVAAMGYKGVQIPTWDARVFNLALAAESATYRDEVQGQVADAGLVISELSTHLQGQLIAVHPAYDAMFDGFAPESVRGKASARSEWAMEQLLMAARVSGHFNLKAHATFSGALLWQMAYPWPQRPAGLVEAGFAELAKRWLPLLQAFDQQGCDLCFELHPGEDLHDGVTFERFLAAVDQHPRANILYDPSHFVLQQLDYLAFIDIYHERIKAFHVKDAEFRPNGRSGVYGGYQHWIDRPGRFRSLGDGQIDFKQIFSKLTQYGYQGWAVLEWECCIKHPEDGAREGAPFIAQHLIRQADRAFDDFASVPKDDAMNRKILGI
ncbi:sugar phosphate isomerase/epimerase [Simiduia curdlanivorans]|uniref:Sugar phosphate isomerase/epimerase family protein n=1 Tax=Simiduia curdlanivorans TaxID=1492769 RepID=A0ABV8V087_9GAMM|nr:sugar phosphate isomerase/epimerase [Simiduia curdlanivorans]MDN3637812.1 sugar phosphate isomerase/epimerase [Simiduia curdlanivorans]